jgi:TPR repeat protein
MRIPLMLGLVVAGMLGGPVPPFAHDDRYPSILTPVAVAESATAQHSPNSADTATAGATSPVDANSRPLAPGVDTVLQAVAAQDKRLPQTLPVEAKAQRTPQQAAKTLERYQNAAAAGFIYAQYNLAQLLVGRRGVAPDVDKAIALLRQIAERGYQPAQMRLAEENLRGEGRGTSKAEAYAWYTVAYHDGSKAAERARSLLGPLLTPSERESADRLSRSFDSTVTQGRQRRPLPAQQKILDDMLMAALDSENIGKIDQLLAQGADPDAIDKVGRSTVINAAWRGRSRIVALLLERGVDADRRDDEGHTALEWAAINGYSDIVQSLLAAGCIADVPDVEGLTPLMRAAWNGHPAVVRALLDNGAAPDLKDLAGKSALDRALSQDDKVIVTMLRDADTKR